MRALLFAVVAAFCLRSHALSGVTVQGRLLRSDSSPVTSTQLQFKIQIRSPGNENCLLYEETQNKDLSSSDGNFSFLIQDAVETSRVRTDTTGLSLEKIFANRSSFSGLSCGSGTSYAPNATDGRVLQVLFREDPTAAWEPMPAQRIAAVPVALQTLQIAGYTSSQLLRVADGSTLAELSAGEATNLSTLIAGTSASFLKPSDLPACNASEYLTKSGSTVSCAPVSGSNGGTVTSVATGTGLTGGPIASSGTISLASIASHTLLGNATGSATAPTATSLSSLMDASFGNAQGQVLYRDASGWTVLAPGTSGQFLKTQGASANPVWDTPSAGGSVSSVDLSAPSIFSVAGNPITSSGTIALSLANQTTNTVFAGPVSGGAAAPGFRALNIPDLRSSVAGAFLTGSGCTAGQALAYNSVNDNISCQSIAVSSSQITTGLGYTPVNKAGDTMSGTLNLAANGLNVGTGQLVVAGGNVGIGTTIPGGTLDVRGGTAASSTDGSDLTLTAQNAGTGGNNNGGSVRLTAGSATGTGSPGSINFNTAGGLQAVVGDAANAANAVNYVILSGAATGSGTGVSAWGADTDVTLDLAAKNGGYVRSYSQNSLAFDVRGVSSAVNFLYTENAATGNGGVLGSDGADTDVNLILSTKGAGHVGIGTTAPQGTLDVVGKTDSAGVGQGIYLTGGAGVGDDGGDIVLQAGTSDSASHGDVAINAGSGNGADAGMINLTAGSTDSDVGGSINLTAGSTTDNENGGSVNLTAGNGGDNGGSVRLKAGNGNYYGGVYLTAGNSAIDNGGAIILTGGNAAVSSKSGGNIVFTPGTNTANAKKAGSVVLNNQTSILSSNGDRDGLNVTVSGANTTASTTHYGVNSSITLTGTTNTNVGGYFSATGGTNNYGLIVAAGAVGIGTTSPQYGLDVAGTARLQGNLYANSLPANSANYYVCQLTGGQITASGTGCTSSDGRVKKDVEDLPASEGLEAILKLRPVTFNWKDDEQAKRDGPQIGLIAQEVRPHFPQLVAESKGDFVINHEDGQKEIVQDKLSVDYQKLTAPIIKAIQELYSKFVARSAEVDEEMASLKAENEEMKQALCELGKTRFCQGPEH